MYTQKPKKAGNYLYQDQSDEVRLFATEVVLPSDKSPRWSECTPEEKAEWEAAHPTPEEEGETE